MDDDQKDSGEEQRDEDEGLGPRSNVSLLDQHQHLKEKAEGIQFKHDPLWIMIVVVIIILLIKHCHIGSVISHLLHVFFIYSP